VERGGGAGGGPPSPSGAELQQPLLPVLALRSSCWPVVVQGGGEENDVETDKGGATGLGEEEEE
jgi:hypothetical protein